MYITAPRILDWNFIQTSNSTSCNFTLYLFITDDNCTIFIKIITIYILNFQFYIVTRKLTTNRSTHIHHSLKNINNYSEISTYLKNINHHLHYSYFYFNYHVKFSILIYKNIYFFSEKNTYSLF